jgi:hypothetical protein
MTNGASASGDIDNTKNNGTFIIFLLLNKTHKYYVNVMAADD